MNERTGVVTSGSGLGREFAGRRTNFKLNFHHDEEEKQNRTEQTEQRPDRTDRNRH